ncbi:response regulator [Desulfosudis oleivorans]|uniref:Response regulator receiver protein n=1 Tax=Desulfosudis oleivorans (strain DSM 6200 / JCM 39069 / Hxd3) TaxID=96561 RepID=A8ZTZ7_DESOH|nr:response regulator [Desulfosudis oleivorans]ABW67930.1 response regulator receiver protein [Desulfosudis oleivorans Hxd3]
MKKDRKVQHHMDPYRVLVAEDDYEMRKLLAGTLKDSGYDVVECPDGMAMLTHLAAFLLPDEFSQEKIDLIISDVRMPGITGMEVLEGKPRHRAFPPMILITAFGDDQTHAMAAQFGAAAMLDKPFDMDDLLGKMTEILH